MANMTLLQIIQKACQSLGITVPNTAVGSADPQIAQLVALAEREGQDLANRYPWQVLQTEVTFTTVAAQIQAQLSTIAPDFEYLVNDTIWNRTLRRPVYGPKSMPDWQQAKAMQINGPFNSFRIIDDAINFYPNPAVGNLCAFEYMSRNWVNVNGASATEADNFANDADVPLLSGQIILLGLMWRWKAAKNLEYAEDFQTYENRVADAMGRDAGKAKLSLTGQTEYEINPVVMIPRGSW
jgi:hypothetical protein